MWCGVRVRVTVDRLELRASNFSPPNNSNSSSSLTLDQCRISTNALWLVLTSNGDGAARHVQAVLQGAGMKEGFGSSSSPRSRFRATPHNFVSNQVTTTVIGHPLSAAIIRRMILSSTHRQNQVVDFPLSRPGSIHRLPVIGPCSNFKFGP